MYSYLICWILILITGITSIIGVIEPEYSIGLLNITFGGVSLALALHTRLNPDKRKKLKRIENRSDNRG